MRKIIRAACAARIIDCAVELRSHQQPGAGGGLCGPKTSSTSCDQVIFVDQATDARLSSDAVLTEIGRLGGRFQRRGAAPRAVRPVLIVVDLVLAQDPLQMSLVPDEGSVQ